MIQVVRLASCLLCMLSTLLAALAAIVVCVYQLHSTAPLNHLLLAERAFALYGPTPWPHFLLCYFSTIVGGSASVPPFPKDLQKEKRKQLLLPCYYVGLIFIM